MATRQDMITQQAAKKLAGDKRLAEENSTTVNIPDGEPNATWSHEQLSTYYDEARKNADWQKMQEANIMSNYIWDISGQPENQQDASDDIEYYKNLQNTLNKNLEGKTGDEYSALIKGYLTTLDSKNNGSTTYVTDIYGDEDIGAYLTNEGNRKSASIRGSKSNSDNDNDNDNDGFSYDPDSDDLWAAYLDRYTQESERAARNAIGEVSANTGGLASSYATTAANQAANYYTQLANDAFLNIYQQKYQQYLDQIEQQNYLNNQSYTKQYNNQQLNLALMELAQSQQQIDQDQANADWEQQYYDSLK